MAVYKHLGVKVAAAQAGLKPYWVKPTVRNFRGGGGNEVHGLVTICHDARKGGYNGSRWPKHVRASTPLDVKKPETCQGPERSQPDYGDPLGRARRES